MIWYNRPPPRTVPVTGKTKDSIECVEECLGAGNDWNGDGLLLTGGAEQGKHSENSLHDSNEACDVAGPKYNPYSDEEVFGCAVQCGFTNGHYEDKPGEDADHWHLQTRPGNGTPTLPVY